MMTLVSEGLGRILLPYNKLFVLSAQSTEKLTHGPTARLIMFRSLLH